MPLNTLAAEIVRLSSGDDRASAETTPVLMIPSYLSFRPEFFRELVAAIGSQTNRCVRIVWLRSGSGICAMLGDAIARHRAARINRTLGGGVMQVSASLGRSDRRSGRLVIGLCEPGARLPPWA